eukprot:TRINITY_DN5861_c0_g1_i5.p1 TRINITY_DN5861_c0_g1~~TRINITY_DN5861_c0_g1_i5.p1  ORF type:complete len:281 (-),score=77.93 TRINITY_DN5861_c0_g1_i5:84-926(-)
MDVMASYYENVDSKLDFVSFYEKLFRETVCYLGIPTEDVNKSEVDLVVHIGSTLDESGIQCKQVDQVKEMAVDLEKKHLSFLETTEFKSSETAATVQSLIPGLKLKKVEKICSEKRCGEYSRLKDPHEVVQMRYTFSSEYGNGGTVFTLEEEHPEGFAGGNFGGAYDLTCYGTVNCSDHGIFVKAEGQRRYTLVEWSPKLSEYWYEYIVEHGPEMGVDQRMNDEDLPDYFLKKWRVIVAYLNVGPLREICSIPSEITDETLCFWLQELSPWKWDIEEVED